MKKFKFVCFILLVIFSVSNCDTFESEYGVDYMDEETSTIIQEPETTTTPINISMSSTSTNSEISTSTNLGENIHEENIRQTLSIFSLKNIESKFNELIVKLDRDQILYVNDTKNSSEALEEEYKSAIKIHIENITKAFDDFKENFEIYQKIKNETEEKMQMVRENYLREIFTIEMIWINDQINYYKEHDKLSSKKQRYITMEKIYNNVDNKTDNTENLAKIKNHFEEIDSKMQNDSMHLKESNQNYLNLTNQVELKMINEMLKLLNDSKYHAISKHFDDFLNIKKTIRNLLKLCTEYSAKTNSVLTDFTKNLSNLSSQLVLSKIMPSDNEIVQISSKTSNAFEIPLQETSQSSDMTNYKWVQAYQGNIRLSENAVVGGQDVDGVVFYVARIKDYKSYLYGKFAFSKGRRHAYFPYEYAEYGVEKFEVIFFQLSNLIGIDQVKLIPEYRF